jgi:hypothetical protein
MVTKPKPKRISRADFRAWQNSLNCPLCHARMFIGHIIKSDSLAYCADGGNYVRLPLPLPGELKKFRDARQA